MSFKKAILQSPARSFSQQLIASAQPTKPFGDPEFQHFSLLWDSFMTAKSTFSDIHSRLRDIRDFLLQFESVPSPSFFSSTLFPLLADLILRFRQDDVCALLASEISLHFASFYVPILGFILDVPFFHAVIQQSYQSTQLHESWVKLLTIALEDSKYGPLLRNSPFLPEYVTRVCSRLSRFSFSMIYNLVIFIGVCALEPGSSACLDVILHAISEYISVRPSAYEIGLLAFLLSRLARWPSFPLSHAMVLDFVHDHYFVSVQWFSQLMIEIHERSGGSIEKIFGITAADILLWIYQQSAENQELSYALGVLVKLFQDMQVIPKDELFEKFPSWVEEIRSFTVFQTRKALAFAMIAFLMKCEEMAAGIIWNPGFWEDIEPFLSDERASELVCATMGLLLREFEKVEIEGQADEIVQLAPIKVLITEWEGRTFCIEGEPIRLAFVRTFGPLMKPEEEIAV
jgi:hypothetical protein